MVTDAPVPSWARDMVITELRKAGPDGIAKDDLQEAVGLGPTDLRGVLDALVDEGWAEGTEDGWAYAEPEVLGQAPDDEADDAPHAPLSPPEPPVPALPEALGGLPQSGPYRARVVVDVMFHREADDDVLALANAFRDGAVAGVLRNFSDLQVAGTVEAIDVFDNPRRVWPPRAGVDEVSE